MRPLYSRPEQAGDGAHGLRASDMEGRGNEPKPVEVLLPSGMVDPKAPGSTSDSMLCVPIESLNAAFVRQLVPTSMTVGQQGRVSVTMRNTGQVPWTAEAGFGLGAQNPPDSRTWGQPLVVVPETIAPGVAVTFVFAITAPVIPGTYNFQWRMLWAGALWFGPRTPNVAVTVHPADLSSLREAVRREAYFIGLDRVRRQGPGDAVSDWFAARAAGYPSRRVLIMRPDSCWRTLPKQPWCVEMSK
jgi:hypothetical protein